MEEIKVCIIDLVHNQKTIDKNLNVSEYLKTKMNKSYHQLSKLFSKKQGQTIEHFFIQHRIEKVKELIQYNQMNFSEIAYSLGYKSPQHLSAQFKKISGLTMKAYKKAGNYTRKPLNEI